MDKKLEIALELTRLVFDANSKGLRLSMDFYGGGESLYIYDISFLEKDSEKKQSIKIGLAYLDDNMSERELSFEGDYKLSELPKVIKEYIENNTK